MERLQAKAGSELFIVDNSDKDWNVRNYLEQWADLSVSFDIATGYFEIGALLALDGQWQKLEKLRILMGDEVSRRTKQALMAGVQTAGTILDASIEKEKELNIQVRREVELLQEWYDRHWNEAHEITEEILRVILRHTREYSPFEVYAKALQEFFRAHEMTTGEWENGTSRMYPVLDQYQFEPYRPAPCG